MSNGSLMKATPMAVFTSLLDKDQARACIEEEVSFLHPNQTVKDAIYLYSIAIHHLVNNPKDEDRAQKAFDLAYAESENMASYNCNHTRQEQSPKIWLDRAK